MLVAFLGFGYLNLAFFSRVNNCYSVFVKTFIYFEQNLVHALSIKIYTIATPFGIGKDGRVNAKIMILLY